MTRALILGATALTLSAGVASAQAVYVTPARPYVTPPRVVVVPPTIYAGEPVISDYYGAPPAVAPPVYDYAPGSTTSSVDAPGPTTKWVTPPPNSNITDRRKHR